MKVRWLGEACVEINEEQNILIDPYYQEEPAEDPDLILVTHEHDDHFQPEVLKRYPEAKLYAPQSVYEEFDVEGEVVSPGGEVGLGIKVLDCRCYGSRGSVAYYYRGVLHTGDAAQFPDLEGEVKILFLACFSDLVDDYIESCQRLKPELIVLYHYSAGDEEAIAEAKEVLEELEEAGFSARIISPGEVVEL